MYDSIICLSKLIYVPYLSIDKQYSQLMKKLSDDSDRNNLPEQIGVLFKVDYF